MDLQYRGCPEMLLFCDLYSEPNSNFCPDFFSQWEVRMSRQMIFGSASARLAKTPTVCRTCIRIWRVHARGEDI